MYINDEPYLLCTQTKKGASIFFIIGAYFKENIKTNILSQLTHLLNRIRKTYTNPTIFIFEDFNLDKKFDIDLIEETLKIKIDEKNKNLITRTQTVKGKKVASTLDLFLTTESLETIQTLDKNSSDHFPLLIKTKIPLKETKRAKTIKIIERNYTDSMVIEKIMKNKEWPTITDLPKTKQLVQKSKTFR